MIETAYDIVRRMEEQYTSGSTTISRYVEFDQNENINKIEAYLNSRHTAGSTDSLGREKPFFNIVTAAVNIWYRATDLDRKNIRIKASKITDRTAAFLATIHLQNWMRRENFGKFLNSWGRTLAVYGSALTKWLEKDGELKATVVPWNTIICDTIDFENNPVVEKIEYTPAQLMQSGYDLDTVKKLIEAKDSREDLNKEHRDNKAEYITLYELHGLLPLAMLKTAKGKDYSETDETTYVQQMHVVSSIKNEDGEYENFTLYCGREKNPYYLTHLIEESDRVLGIGAVEHLFDAQWMVNHSQKLIKDQLDLASQMIFQTSDGSFTGRNVLASIVNGDILIHAENQPLTQLANNSHDITALMSFNAQWQNLSKEVTATPDAIRANTQPSGTAYRLQELLTNEAHSLFEIMTENKALHLEDMLRRFVLPHIRKNLKNKDEIAADLTSQGISEFDSMYIPSEVARRINKKVIDKILNEQIVEESDINDLAKQSVGKEVQSELDPMGNQRYIEPDDVEDWNALFKDLEWNVIVEITDEAEDKNAVLTTLSTVLQTIATNPMVLQNPDMKVLFNKILETAGSISPLEFNRAKMAQPQLSVAAQQPTATLPLTPQTNAQ